MTRNSVESMKTDEMKLLYMLKTHANENINELGRKCGFSPQKVARIINKLEKEKIIWGYSAISEVEANGCTHFILLVKRSMISVDAGEKKEGIIEKIGDGLPGSMKIEDIYMTHGKYDFVFTFCATDIISAKKFVQDITLRFGQYIGDYLLLETLFPIRKQGHKNPNIEKLVDYI